MTARSVAVALLTGAGVAVVVLSCLGLLVVRDALTRLHLLTPVTSLGAPLVGSGVALDLGADLAAGEVLLAVTLLAVTGPALTSELGALLLPAAPDGEEERP